MQRVTFLLPVDLFYKMKQLAEEGPEAVIYREAVRRYVQEEIMKGQK